MLRLAYLYNSENLEIIKMNKNVCLVEEVVHRTYKHKINKLYPFKITS